MTDQHNRKLVEDYLNAWVAGDQSKLERLLDDGFKFNAPAGFAADKEGAIEMARQYHEGFPDMHLTYDNWVSQGDNVAVHAVCRGTHKGDFMGVPATNKRADIEGVAIVRLRDGKVVEDISQFDQLGLMTQIGAVSPPGAVGRGPSASRPARPLSGRSTQGEHEMERRSDL